MNQSNWQISKDGPGRKLARRIFRRERYKGLLVLLFIVLLTGSAMAKAAAPGEDLAGVADTSQASPLTTPAITPQPVFSDFGDAPDSTNNFGVTMTAYASSGVLADFPTVFSGSLPRGPQHKNIRAYFLGNNVSREEEADMGFDADGIHNLEPLNDDPNNDAFDNAFVGPLGQPPHCQLMALNYVVTVRTGGPYTAYVNLWFDWIRDGAWGNVPTCSGGVSAPEWAVQNHQISLPGPGTYTLTTPAFLPYNPGPGKGPMWMRITLSDQPATHADGRGPDNGYNLGETEDYMLPGFVPED